MAKTFYDLLKEMMASNLSSDVTKTIQDILTALNNVLSVEAIQGYLSMFMGFAASLLIIFFLIELYNKASKDVITIQQLALCFLKLIISVLVVILTPQILHATFQISLAIYGTIEKHTDEVDNGSEMYLYGVRIGFDSGKAPAKKTEKSITEKKENIQKKDKEVYLFQSTQQTDAGSNGQMFRVYENEATLLAEHPNVVKRDKSDTSPLTGDEINGVYYCYKGTELKSVLENLGISTDSVIDYDVIENGDSGKQDLSGKVTLYKADGSEVTLNTGEAGDDVLDEDGFPSFEHCNAKTGTTEDGDVKPIQEAMEESFGATWVGAATKGSFSIITLFLSILFSLANKLCKIIILVYCITNAISIMVRTVYAPFAVVQMFEDGSNNNAVRYLKKYAGATLSMVTIGVVFFAASKLQAGIVQSIVGDVYLTSANIDSVIADSYIFLIVRIGAVVAILGGAKLCNDVVGA